ncbi:hypothetical protein [uncultured Mailhella sp.]|uniref:hypothetical protein n=1 Tax=uncultured Mailhella sp. TaxID=1981031 RepID=UPI0025E9E14B|nr:hypothetical protein [uncultured Mailhella sp.]
MNTIKTLPEFATLSELEVNAALDAYDDSVEEEHSSCGGGEENTPTTESPIVTEVFRLIHAYTDRMNTLIVEAKAQNREISENFLADMFSFEPEAPIERIAFDFVTDAMLDEDDDEQA